MNILAKKENTMEIHTQKPRKANNNSIPKFSKDTKQIFTSWLMNNVKNPYPTEDRILQWTHETGMNMGQIKNWFMNARRKDRFENIVKPQKPKKLKKGLKTYTQNEFVSMISILYFNMAENCSCIINVEILFPTAAISRRAFHR